MLEERESRWAEGLKTFLRYRQKSLEYQREAAVVRADLSQFKIPEVELFMIVISFKVWPWKC